MTKFSIRHLLLLAMLLLVVTGMAAPVYSQDAVAWELLTLLNQARSSAGLPPLTMNSLLVTAAQRHSTDMAVGEFLSHTGSDGSNFQQRVADAGYVMAAGAENALYRFDTSAAGVFEQWNASPPHRANMMNPDYFDVGIAFAQGASGKYYFTMVLGAQPGAVAPVIPPTIPPLPTATPTATPIPPSPTNTVMPTPVSVQPTLPPPPPTQAVFPTFTPIVVPYQPTMTPIIILPPSATPAAPPTQGVFPTFTPFVMPVLPSETPTALMVMPIQPTVTPDPVDVLGNLLMWALRSLIPQPTTTPPPTQIVQLPAATPAPVSVQPDIRLTYSWDGLTLLNVSGRPLDLRGLVFTSAAGTMAVERWDTEYLTQPLSGFTAGDCLQVWGLDSGGLGVPNDCRYRHAWITVDSSAAFWRSESGFTVRRGDQTLAQCNPPDGVCAFSFSDSVTAVPITTRPQADLRLVYSPDSFALINISGHSLDIRGLIFQSASGSMPVEHWNTEYLTQPLSNFTPWDCLQAWGLGGDMRAKPAECQTRHAWIAVGDTYMFWQNADRFTVNRSGVELGVCNVAHGVCEISLSSAPFTSEQPASPVTGGVATAMPLVPTAAPNFVSTADVRLVYSFDSFAIVNVSGRNLDLSQLAFESDNGVMLATDWISDSLTHPLTSFPSGDCLQVWGTSETMRDKPGECRFRHAWKAVRADLQFWRDVSTFRVRQGASLLATCTVSAGVCEFNLP